MWTGETMVRKLAAWSARRGLFFLGSLLLNGIIFYILFHVQFPINLEEFSLHDTETIPVMLTSFKSPSADSPGSKAPAGAPDFPQSRTGDNPPPSGAHDGRSTTPGVPIWAGIPAYGSSAPLTLKVPLEGIPDLSLKPEMDILYLGTREPLAVFVENDFLQYWQPVVTGKGTGIIAASGAGAVTGQEGTIRGNISFPAIKGYNLLPWARKVITKMVRSWDKILEEKPMAKGFAEIRITISRKGAVVAREVVKISPSPVIKEKMIRLIDQGSPFPPLPKTYPQDQLVALLKLSCQ